MISPDNFRRPYPEATGLAVLLSLVTLGVLALAVLVGVAASTIIEWAAGLVR
jgi:hypothetical protein